MTTLQEMLAKRRGISGAPVLPKREARYFGTDPISDESPGPRRLRVVILTYERPEPLLQLLNDIIEHRADHEISVAVYDDASRADYAKVRVLLDQQGWEYVRARQNHGKHGFWRWVSRIYTLQTSRPERLFVMLPDDMRLCSRFFDRVVNTWLRIEDSDKVSLNLIRDDSRDGQACWTHQKPMDCGPVFDIGWVDGAILCNRRYFKALGWQLDPVDPIRWRADPTASSGVGQQLSLRLYQAGLGMYGVKRSLVAHVAGPSKMNPVERRKNPLFALHFIDGPAAHKELAGASPQPRIPAPAKSKARRKPVAVRRPRAIPTPRVGGVKKIK